MGNRSAGRTLRRAVFAGVVAGVVLCTACRPSKSAGTNIIRVGAPDGAGGLLVNYAAAMYGNKELKKISYGVSPIEDCCSVDSQWALSSQSVDAAVVCTDAAKSLLEKDKRYEMVGPCLVNSDVLVIRGSTSDAQRIGVIQNHSYQSEIVAQLLGPGRQTIPMSSGALAYAYEKGEVDGVVTDIEEALRLPGTRLSVKGDLVTYVLVARRDLPGLAQLVTDFQQAATELNKPEMLQEALGKYGNGQPNGDDAAEWTRQGVRFTAPK